MTAGAADASLRLLSAGVFFPRELKIAARITRNATPR